MTGQCGCHGRSRSNACAACSTRSSWWRSATICIPIGRPSFESPTRSEHAGCHDKLNGIVNDATPQASCRLPSVSLGNGPFAGGGSYGTVGVTSRSYFSNTDAAHADRLCRACAAWLNPLRCHVPRALHRGEHAALELRLVLGQQVQMRGRHLEGAEHAPGVAELRRPARDLLDRVTELLEHAHRVVRSEEHTSALQSLTNLV